jgi:hypothetical protein
VKKLYEAVKFFRFGRWQIDSGMVPESMLCATSSCSIFSNSPKNSGKLPINLLKETSSTVSSVSKPNSAGTQELRPQFMRIISFNVFDMFAMPAGRHPLNLLLASTSTDTGELPMLSGI